MYVFLNVIIRKKILVLAKASIRSSLRNFLNENEQKTDFSFEKREDL